MKPSEERKHVWSCGGGTQSVAIGALIVQGRIRKPDIAVIADTGMEKQSTWDYLDFTLRPALASVGVEIHRVKRSEWAAPWAKELFASSGQALVPVFTTESGRVGKLPAYCSSGWKKEVVDRWLSNAHGITASKRVKWLGFSFDESRRWVKHHGKDDVWLPLVDGVRMKRHECVRLVESMGWPTPPRSNCWMCPNQSDDEWREVKCNRPEEFQRAVEVEREIRKQDPHAWLHKQCVPLDKVDFSKPQMEFARACDSGECFV